MNACKPQVQGHLLDAYINDLNRIIRSILAFRYHAPGQSTLRGSLLDRNYDADIAENRRLLALPGMIRHVNYCGQRN